MRWKYSVNKYVCLRPEAVVISGFRKRALCKYSIVSTQTVSKASQVVFFTPEDSPDTYCLEPVAANNLDIPILLRKFKLQRWTEISLHGTSFFLKSDAGLMCLCTRRMLIKNC